MSKLFSGVDFSKKLFKCHNIIRDNDKLSPEAAFDEISKILFIKIRKERDDIKGIYTDKVYKKEKTSYNATNKTLTDYYQQLFNLVKEHYANEGLFEPHERIRIRENSFEQIIKELEKYNLSKISADIKGLAFEQFLGTTFRGELGQFFTPRSVVDFMVAVLDPDENDLICDPCCGSGGFLIKAFQYVRAKVEKSKKYTEDEKKELTQTVASKHLYGTDANPRMARTAKMNMIMHGDGHSGIHHHDGLLNVNDIFEERFRIILTNPPFGAHVGRTLLITDADRMKDEALIAKYKEEYGERFVVSQQQIVKNINKPLLNLYHTGKMTGLTEVLFLERCLNLLEPGGRMGIVLPEGVMDGNKLHHVRQYIESRARILFIVSLPQEVFMKSGASVKPSILFLKRFTEKDQQEYNKTAKAVAQEIEAMHASEIEEISSSLQDNITAEEKKLLYQRKKQLHQKIENEKEHLLKTRMNYDIPMAKVNKAGIGSRGEVVENELIDLGKEFTKYRKKVHLW